MNVTIRYPFPEPPHPGEAMQVAPGVWWVRMPLPFKLDHINLWLLEDQDGWTAVDTGVNNEETRAHWQNLASRMFREKPLRRLIVTHFHPDHMGLAGWLCETFSVPLVCPQTEWLFARMLTVEEPDSAFQERLDFYRRAGLNESELEMFRRRRNAFQQQVSPVPSWFLRIKADDQVEIGGRAWQCLTVSGHAPEQACLSCPELGVLIGGDQILPTITPNVSVWPYEPEANPLRQFLDSFSQFHSLPDATLVLPSHRLPFYGLHQRIRELVSHHQERSQETLAACMSPRSVRDVLQELFQGKSLDPHQMVFALGETLAHLNYLMNDGRIERASRADGVYLYRAVEIG